MQFYSQTLEDIPKQFLSHQKNSDTNEMANFGKLPKTADLMFILAVLLFLQDEPLFSK